VATNNTINRIELIGYMGATPELRFTASGTLVTNFSLATNRYWKDQAGEQRKATDWHRIMSWGRLAEVVNQFMAQGKRVRVIGRLEYQTCNDKATGEPRSRAVIVASRVLSWTMSELSRAWRKRRKLTSWRSRMPRRRPSWP
jgi:single-strand DNA-binding protein